MSSVPCGLSGSPFSTSALSCASAPSASVLSAEATPADALFASALQCSDKPSPGQVRQAIAAAVVTYGGSGCAARVAQAFGERPETAVTRMRWARAMVIRALPATRLAA
jgi:hypothetical protein